MSTKSAKLSKQSVFWRNTDISEVLGGRILPLSMANDWIPRIGTFHETWNHWTCISLKITQLGGGFKYFLFSPLPGEMIQFDYYFSNGLKPPTRQTVMKDFCLIKCSSPIIKCIYEMVFWKFHMHLRSNLIIRNFPKAARRSQISCRAEYL